MLNEIPVQAPDGQPFRLLTLRNDAGMVVTLMDWGATLLSARIPLSDGSVREALLGCASPEQYPEQAAFLGASIGRYANRIANSRYTFAGETVELLPSQGNNQLHGGPDGFDKRRWQIVNQNDRQVLFALTSDDGDQGFPGHLCATAQYRLTDDNRISITYRATVDKPCPVNLTNHVYFNLDGDKTDVRQHKLQILADEYLPVDEMGIPHDGLKSVAGSTFDFRTPKIISSEFLADDDQRKVKGYDHAFLLQAQGNARTPVAQLWSQDENCRWWSTPRPRHCSFTPVISSVVRLPAGQRPTKTGKAWHWKVNFCRTARTTLSGHRRIASCVRVKSMPA